jgi:hypothetical protein
MSTYVLKRSGSNDIINVIEWDGLSPIYTGSFVAELADSFYSFPSESLKDDFLGNLDPDNIQIVQSTSNAFSGTLTGSVKIDNQPLDVYLNSTRYGKLTYFSSSIESPYPNDYGFSIVNENNSTHLILSLQNRPNSDDNLGYFYSSSLGKILENTSSNYIIRLNEIYGISNKEYVISGSSKITDGETEYVKLDVENAFNYNNLFKSEEVVDISLFDNSTWHIDFDLNTKAQAGTFYGDVKAEGVLSVNDSVAVTTDLGCNLIFALNRVVRDAYVLEKGDYEISQAITPRDGFTYAFYWDANWFWIIKPKYDWDVEFYIGFPKTSMLRHTVGPNYIASQDTDHGGKEGLWGIIVNEIVNTKNKESIVIKFDGLRDNTGGEFGNILSRKSATNTYLYVQPTDSPTVSFDVNSGNDTIIFLPVKVIPGGISNNLSRYNDQNRPSAGEANQTLYQGYTFCATVDFLGTCNDCDTESDDTEDITNIGNSTDIDMQWNNIIMYKDPNVTIDAETFEAIEVGDITIADTSRTFLAPGLQEDKPLGKWENYPIASNVDIKYLVVRLSDSDVDNTTLYDGTTRETYYYNNNTKFEPNNSIYAKNPDMFKLYNELKQINLIQNIKSYTFGKNNIDQLTSLLTLRCLNDKHVGTLEQFDIKSVKFLKPSVEKEKAAYRWHSKVSAGGDTSAALKNKTSFSKSLWMWGSNEYYNTSNPKQELDAFGSITTNTPYRVNKNSWNDVSIGGGHTLALDDDGFLWAWGDNTNGQLGLEFRTITKPTRVTTTTAASQAGNDIKFRRFHSISSGRNHSAAIYRNNSESVEETRTLLMCGDNSYRQIPNFGSNPQPGILAQFSTMGLPPRSNSTYMDV